MIRLHLHVNVHAYRPILEMRISLKAKIEVKIRTKSVHQAFISSVFYLWIIMRMSIVSIIAPVPVHEYLYYLQSSTARLDR